MTKSRVDRSEEEGEGLQSPRQGLYRERASNTLYLEFELFLEVPLKDYK